ncbi:hypothetical protein AcV5_002337 [Taiwanofungus camphoratus]|nr:hypothetical protein AcV5_002337 [Antrodia cinnamomea]
MFITIEQCSTWTTEPQDSNRHTRLASEGCINTASPTNCYIKLIETHKLTLQNSHATFESGSSFNALVQRHSDVDGYTVSFDSELGGLRGRQV